MKYCCWLLCCAILFLPGCSDLEGPEPIVSTFDIAGFSISTKELNFCWHSQDTLGVYQAENDEMAFVYDTATQTFRGGGWNFRGGYHYTAFYPFKFSNRTSSAVDIDYASQQLDVSNAQGAFCRQKYYLCASAEAASDGVIHFTFHPVGALLCLTLHKSPGFTIRQLVLEASQPIIPVAQRLSLSTTPVIANTLSWNSSLTADVSGDTNACQTVKLFLMLPATNEISVLDVTILDTQGAQHSCAARLVFDNGIVSGHTYKLNTSVS